jgi:protein gp37
VSRNLVTLFATPQEWIETAWNPVRGCAPVSEGCLRCYAAAAAAALSDPSQPFHGIALRAARRTWPAPLVPMHEGPAWTGALAVDLHELAAPYRWEFPRLVFAGTMSDLFHERIPIEGYKRLFEVVDENRKHLFQILTKRPLVAREVLGVLPGERPNLWLGVSVENQETARRRIRALAQVDDVGLRFAVVEPLLEQVSLRGQLNALDWVVIGGELGPGARRCDVEWIRRLVEECTDAGKPVFVKQLGGEPFQHGVPLPLREPHGADEEEWPEGLNVRLMPALLKGHIVRYQYRPLGAWRSAGGPP